MSDGRFNPIAIQGQYKHRISPATLIYEGVVGREARQSEKCSGFQQYKNNELVYDLMYEGKIYT